MSALAEIFSVDPVLVFKFVVLVFSVLFAVVFFICSSSRFEHLASPEVTEPSQVFWHLSVGLVQFAASALLCGYSIALIVSIFS